MIERTLRRVRSCVSSEIINSMHHLLKNRLSLLRQFKFTSILQSGLLFKSLRIQNHNRLIDKFGHRFYGDDYYTFSEVFIQDDYGATLLHCSAPVDVIVDVGANVGYATRWFSNNLAPARIIAFEPMSVNVQLFRENTSHLQNVDLREYAVGNKNEPCVPFFFAGGGSSRQSSGAQAEAVEVRDIFDELSSIGRISVLKMDIEGAEHSIILDSRFTELLARCDVFVVELHSTTEMDVYSHKENVVKVLSMGERTVFQGREVCGFAMLIYSVRSRVRN
jgi:FkbM family methyltransferase